MPLIYSIFVCLYFFIISLYLVALLSKPLRRRILQWSEAAAAAISFGVIHHISFFRCCSPNVLYDIPEVVLRCHHHHRRMDGNQLLRQMSILLTILAYYTCQEKCFINKRIRRFPSNDLISFIKSDNLQLYIPRDWDYSINIWWWHDVFVKRWLLP